MKRMLCFLTAALTVVVLSACAGLKPRLTFISAEEEGMIFAEEAVNQALAAYRQADPFRARPDPDKDPEFNGYRKETETDAESDTSIDRYYDGDTLVYVDYNGYGEDSFQVFPADRQSLLCTDDEGKRTDVRFAGEFGGYSIEISPAGEMEQKYYYGSADLYVSVSPSGDRDGIAAFSQYRIDTQKGAAYVQYARFQKSDENWYEYYYDEESGACCDVLYAKLEEGTVPNIAGEAALPAQLSRSGAASFQLMLGCGHKFFWSRGEGGIVQWYVNAPLYVIFEDEKQRDKFYRSHPIGECSDFEDDSAARYYWQASALLAVTENTVLDPNTDVYDLIGQEFNDPTAYQVTFDENGGLASLQRSSFQNYIY